MKGFEHSHSPHKEDDMLIVPDLLIEVNELLPDQRKREASVEDVIGMVLDKHQIFDKEIRLKLSAAIILEHVNQTTKRMKERAEERIEERHKLWREREERQGLV